MGVFLMEERENINDTNGKIVNQNHLNSNVSEVDNLKDTLKEQTEEFVLVLKQLVKYDKKLLKFIKNGIDKNQIGGKFQSQPKDTKTTLEQKIDNMFFSYTNHLLGISNDLSKEKAKYLGNFIIRTITTAINNKTAQKAKISFFEQQGFSDLLSQISREYNNWEINFNAKISSKTLECATAECAEYLNSIHKRLDDFYKKQKTILTKNLEIETKTLFRHIFSFVMNIILDLTLVWPAVNVFISVFQYISQIKKFKLYNSLNVSVDLNQFEEHSKTNDKKNKVSTQKDRQKKVLDNLKKKIWFSILNLILCTPPILLACSFLLGWGIISNYICIFASLVLVIYKCVQRYRQERYEYFIYKTAKCQYLPDISLVILGRQMDVAKTTFNNLNNEIKEKINKHSTLGAQMPVYTVIEKSSYSSENEKNEDPESEVIEENLYSSEDEKSEFSDEGLDH